MKQIIMDVLDDMSESQINLSSEAARKTIAGLISATLNDRGRWIEFDEQTLNGQRAKESWVCDICGKNTYDVDWDYIGSGTNHLGCELELEMKEKAFNQDNSVDKLSEEIIDSRDIGYIYESPDSGKTIYRRKMGESKKELVDEDEWERARKYHGDSW